MRVGFVLRSAEIKPLVPKICDLLFSFSLLKTKTQTHLTPPPKTNKHPPKKNTSLHQHTSGMASHTHTHRNPNLTRLPLKKDGEQKKTTLGRKNRTTPQCWVFSSKSWGVFFRYFASYSYIQKTHPNTLGRKNRTRHDIFS